MAADRVEMSNAAITALGQAIADALLASSTPLATMDSPGHTYFNRIELTPGQTTPCVPERDRRAINIISFHSADVVFIGTTDPVQADYVDGSFPLAPIPAGGFMGGDIRSTRSRSAFYATLAADADPGFVYVIEVY